MGKNTAVALLATIAILTGAGTTQAAKPTGAIFTTHFDGSVVNANHFDSKCAVYLDGGPGPNAPAKAAGLPDGDYYFQVTDPSGGVLLSTDPVANRRFQVSGGVIVAYTGDGSGPVHPTGVDLDHSELGAITIGLANLTCPADYLDTPSSGGVYKVWATPVDDFQGDPTLVDNDCGGGCSHGFVPSKSKTDNFKVEPTTATFCLTVNKEFADFGPDSPYFPRENWLIQVQDSVGVINERVTSDGSDGGVFGQVQFCGLTAGAYTVTEEQQIDTAIGGLIVNGTALPAQPTYSFVWAPGDPEPVITFQNYGSGVIGLAAPWPSNVEKYRAHRRSPLSCSAG